MTNLASDAKSGKVCKLKIWGDIQAKIVLVHEFFYES